MTPTVNLVDPTLIDDFEQTGAATDPGDDSNNIYYVTDQAGHLRDGNWFAATDTTNGSSVVASYTSASAFAGSYAAEFSGTMALQASYASCGFSFTNPNDATFPPNGNQGVSFYDATVGSRYTGIVFEIEAKSITPCTGVQSVIVDMVDISPTGTTLDHQIAVPVTSAYQAVTIFYNQCLSSTGVALQPVSMYQMVFKPQSYGDPNYTYDFVVDNVSLTNAVAPTAASSAAWPNGNTVIDTFQNGINDTESPWLVSTGKTPGYLSDDADATAGALCPTYTSGAPSQLGFCLDIATGAGLPTVVTGVPGFEAHLSDPNIDYGPPSYAGYCGMGFYFDNSQPAGGTDISQGGAFSTLNFWAKSSNGTNVSVVMNDSATYKDNCYGASNNFVSITPPTTWTKYTIGFNSALGTYTLGTPTIASGTNGCTINVASPHDYSYTTAEQISWQPQGGTPTAIDVAVADIYLQ